MSSDLRRIIDCKADLSNFSVSRRDVLVAKKGEVREYTGEVVVLLASSATAWSGHRDALDQRDLCPVVKRSSDVLARMRIE